MTGLSAPPRTRPRLVALFLTDIEASSALWHADPDAMSHALDLLEARVVADVSEGDGTVVRARGEGDSHFAVFPHVSGAMRSAVGLQRSLASAPWPGGCAPRTRIAVHVGEVRGRDDDFVGTAVNRAARLRAVAHGGQIVAGAAAVELATDVDAEIRFESLGRHRIRDFRGWTEVFQVCAPGLEHDFPPLVTLDKGLPPLAAVVMLDCIGMSRRFADDEWKPLIHDVTALFATEFTAASGEYLKQVGDGCLALFSDPDAALAFARATLSSAARLGIELRGAIDVGRVEFAHNEPIGVVLHETARLVRSAAAGQFVAGRAATALLPGTDDVRAVKPRA